MIENSYSAHCGIRLGVADQVDGSGSASDTVRSYVPGKSGCESRTDDTEQRHGPAPTRSFISARFISISGPRLTRAPVLHSR